VLCDEPVAALDASISAQVLNLLMDLQHELDLTYIIISHDLSIVEAMAHRVAVMRAGCIVEIGETETGFAAPEHAYTQQLLAAAPSPFDFGRRP
jgi:ABC-type oligopeptide transport system ATPase subunit